MRRRRKREAGFWQQRFREHTVRDALDFVRHFDYIHYNPVKHQLARNVSEWPWSTFHRYRKEGVYGHDWGRTEPESIDGFECPGE